MRESEHVVKEWNAMAEEEPCSGWNQVQKQVHTNQPKEIGESRRVESTEKIGNSEKTSLTMRLSWEDVRMIFIEEGHSVELDFEAIKRIGIGEERCWTTIIEGIEDVQWRKRNTKVRLGRRACVRERGWTEVTPTFGHSLNVTDVTRASVSVLIRRRKDRRKGRCWVCRAILRLLLN